MSIRIDDNINYFPGENSFYIERNGHDRMITTRALTGNEDQAKHENDKHQVIQAIANDKIAVEDLNLSNYFQLKKFLVVNQCFDVLKVFNKTFNPKYEKNYPGYWIEVFEQILDVLEGQSSHEDKKESLEKIFSTCSYEFIMNMLVEFDDDNRQIYQFHDREIFYNLISEYLKLNPGLYCLLMDKGFFKDDKKVLKFLFCVNPKETEKLLLESCLGYLKNVIEDIQDIPNISNSSILKEKLRKRTRNNDAKENILSQHVLNLILNERSSRNRKNNIWQLIAEERQEIKRKCADCSDIFIGEESEFEEKFSRKIEDLLAFNKNVQKKLIEAIVQVNFYWNEIVQEEKDFNTPSKVLKPSLLFFGDRQPLTMSLIKKMEDKGWYFEEVIENFQFALERVTSDNHYDLLGNQVHNYLDDFRYQEAQLANWSSEIIYESCDYEKLSKDIVTEIKNMKDNDFNCLWIPAGTEDHAIYLLVLSGRSQSFVSGF